MSKPRIGNEAKTINLFLSLSDEGKRIVLDVLKSQSATPRKISTKKQAAATQGAATADKKSDARCAARVTGTGGAEIPCGYPEDNPIHDKTFGYAGYHEFVAAKPARKKRKKKDPPAVIPIEGQGVDLAAELES
jgi:hypothetical protein